MRFLPFKVYHSNYGNLKFLYWEEITNMAVFVDEDGFIFIFENDIEFDESIVGLN
tara:strand:- start:2 stop:166 length:165 start_codon:yes stop_codon:yes gene_type:complete